MVVSAHTGERSIDCSIGHVADRDTDGTLCPGSTS